MRLRRILTRAAVAGLLLVAAVSPGLLAGRFRNLVAGRVQADANKGLLDIRAAQGLSLKVECLLALRPCFCKAGLQLPERRLIDLDRAFADRQGKAFRQPLTGLVLQPGHGRRRPEPETENTLRILPGFDQQGAGTILGIFAESDGERRARVPQERHPLFPGRRPLAADHIERGLQVGLQDQIGPSVQHIGVMAARLAGKELACKPSLEIGRKQCVRHQVSLGRGDGLFVAWQVGAVVRTALRLVLHHDHGQEVGAVGRLEHIQGDGPGLIDGEAREIIVPGLQLRSGRLAQSRLHRRPGRDALLGAPALGGVIGIDRFAQLEQSLRQAPSPLTPFGDGTFTLHAHPTRIGVVPARPDPGGRVRHDALERQGHRQVGKRRQADGLGNGGRQGRNRGMRQQHTVLVEAGLAAVGEGKKISPGCVPFSGNGRPLGGRNLLRPEQPSPRHGNQHALRPPRATKPHHM